jgi:ParB-like chromosome segregation protein Spo0J
MTEQTWQGANSLRQHLVAVDEVMPHPDNPRRGNPERIAESLRRFGQVRPVLVRKASGEIVAGNHTYRAATEILGWSHIAVVYAEMDEEEARAYLVADNRLSDMATNDDAALASILAKLADEGRLEGTGYTADEYDDLLANLNKIAEAPQEPFGGGYAETPEQREAREALREKAVAMREVVLMFDQRRHAQFSTFVAMLAKEYGTEGIIDTVYEAVKRGAEAL